MKKYSTLLFDADDTLLDFEKTARASIEKIFNKLGYGCSEEMQRRFQTIDRELWKEHQENKITMDTVLTVRFEKLFDTINIKVDGKEIQAIFNELLSQGSELIDGALEVCKKLNEKYDLYVVSNGIQLTQDKRFKDSGLFCFMKEIFVSDMVGHHKPKKEFFEYVFNNIPNTDKSEMIIIGDSLLSDIKGANNAGIDSCWFNPKRKQNDSNSIPTYEIQELKELFNIL